MSKARSDLCSRLNTLRDCLAETVLVEAPTDPKKDSIAAMYRNGLAVLSFAILEAFMRDRTAEVLTGLSNAVRFTDLSEKLQFATTIGALNAIIFRSKLEDKANQVNWTLLQLPAVSNAATNVSNLSEFSFAQQKSNVGEADVTEIMKAFGIEGGWGAISSIAKRIGLGGAIDYKQSFTNIADRRHAAAHDVTIKIPLNDLTDAIKHIIGICCSFDLLVSHSLSLHNLHQIPNSTRGQVKAEHIKLRFISTHPKKPGIFREQVEIIAKTKTSLKTLKNHLSLAVAETAALTNCNRHHQQLVFRDGMEIPERWCTW